MKHDNITSYNAFDKMRACGRDHVVLGIGSFKKKL